MSFVSLVRYYIIDEQRVSLYNVKLLWGKKMIQTKLFSSRLCLFLIPYYDDYYFSLTLSHKWYTSDIVKCFFFCCCFFHNTTCSIYYYLHHLSYNNHFIYSGMRKSFVTDFLSLTAVTVCWIIFDLCYKRDRAPPLIFTT